MKRAGHQAGAFRYEYLILTLYPEVSMAEPASQRNLTKVWIWALVLILVIWAIYALSGGPSTPPGTTAADSAVEPAR
jgi:hypothetical protein